MSKMLSGKIRKTPSNQVSTGRYDFISLQETEPDLGVPGINNSFAASLVDGTRLWLYPNTGLTIDGNGNIDVDETTLFINTANLSFSNANVLSNVLLDIDTNITAINADLANALNVYTNDTLSGNGSISNVLIVEKWNSEITIDVLGDVSGSVSFDGSSNANLTLGLINTGVVSGTYGSGTQIPSFTVDNAGRITDAGLFAIDTSFFVTDGNTTANVENGGTITVQGVPNEITTNVTTNSQVIIGLVDSPVVGNITANFTVTANTITDGVASLSNGLLTGQVSDISNHDTDDLAEGSNLYFTVERVRSNISVVDTGGDGSLDYDTGNGIITYTGPDQTEANARIAAAPTQVRQHISATGNINYDSNTGVISESLTTDDIDEGSNLYFTVERVRSNISVVDTGGDGSLVYDTANGIITYTGPDQAEANARIDAAPLNVRQHISASGNINYDSSTGVISESLTTTDIDEGINLYFTVERVRSNISVVDTGGDGSLDYDTGNGIITYTGPDQAEANARIDAAPLNVRQHISATGNINYDSNTGVISESLTTTDIDEGSNLYFTVERVRSNISVVDAGGDGSLTYSNVTGIFTYTGPSQAEVNARIDAAAANVRQHISSFGNINYDSNTGVISQNLTTDDIIEGDDNQYFTTSRARTSISAENASGDGSISYDSGSGVITYTGPDQDEANARIDAAPANVRQHISATGNINYDSSTGVISESLTTTDIDEGINLYFTVERVRSNISVVDAGGDGNVIYDTANGIITYTGPNQDEANARIDAAPANVRQHISAVGNISYDSNTGVISESLTTDDINEGTNLYFTTARARTSISVTNAGGDGNISYDNVSGVITYNGPDQDEANARIDAAPANVRQHISATGNINYDNVTGVISESLTTTDIDEGINLYFTDERVDDRIANLLVAGTSIEFNYNDAGDAFTVSVANVDAITLDGLDSTQFLRSDEDDTLTGNLDVTGNITASYIIGNISVSSLVGLTTDAVDEGTFNLYFTDERVDDRVANLLQTTGNLSFTYNDGSNTLTLSESLTTDDIDEGTNLYYTNARVQAYLLNGVTDISTSGNVSVGADVVVTGNLFVNGTTTVIESVSLTVDDKNIELGNVDTPTDITADGGGITLLGSTNKTLNWIDATDSWTSSENFDLASGKTYKINNVDVLSATTLGSGVVNSSLETLGTISSGTWQGSVIQPTYGGTGVNNGSNTITLGGNFVTSGGAVQFTSITGDVQLQIQTGTNAIREDNLGVFNTTTSAQLFGVISDPTGTGSLVFSNSPTLVSPVLGSANATTVTTSGDITVGNDITVINDATVGNDLTVEGEVIDATSTGEEVARTTGIVTTINTTSITPIDSWAFATYRSAKYLIQVEQGSDYQVSELRLIHDGTTVYTTEYAVIETGGKLADFTGSITGSDVQVTVSMSSGALANIRIQRTLITV